MYPEPINVLLAHRQKAISLHLSKLLSNSLGRTFEFHAVQGADKALYEMSRSEYDVCLLDEQISSDRGIELIKRTLSVRAEAPIIVLAQSDDLAFDSEASGAGAMDLLVLSELTSGLLERAIRHAIERKRIEAALTHAQQKAKQLAAIVEGADFAIKGKTLEGIITSWNPAAEALYGYSADEVIGQSVSKFVPPDRPNEVNELLNRISRGEKIKTFETVRLAKDGTQFDVALTISPIRDDSGRIVGASTFALDIRQRKLAEAQIERQIQRIQALRNIDMAITGSLDLRVTLSVLLDQVTTHLRVDAADVLLFNNYTHRLEFATGRGFRTTALQRTSLKIGECTAGRSVRDREVVHINDFRKDPKDFGRSLLISKEDFVSYWAAPLIAKGRVEGVLEIYHRSPLPGDADWVSFLETLAGQAAIAIENADLFTDLQRSNIELQLAYDSTLEGWSKALDLRDKETEGHTLRVTEATMRLAKAMDVPDQLLMHIRRGALLHDIGKMGIPDSILLKPDSLTEDEWVVMKEHPVYAYELLSPITFLREALDIPYCHHEWWDGHGYPRGLMGEQIPLAARIFAVIDVWDALVSDRPYRKAWPAQKVRAYIIDSSGTQFDPRIVQAFLALDLLT